MIKLKYPKLIFLFFTYLFAYFIFKNVRLESINLLAFNNIFLAFLGGLFYVYSFSAGPATVILLIIAKHTNFFFTIAYALIGAILSDIAIYNLVKHSFADEILALTKEKYFIKIKNKFPYKIPKTFVFIIAAIFIASPLPTEFGILLMSKVVKLPAYKFIVLVFLLHIVGISTVLYLGSKFY